MFYVDVILFLADPPPPQDLVVSIPLGVFTVSPVVALENRLLGLQMLPQGMLYSNILC